MKTRNFINLILRLVVSLILLQTLYFKFTGHPDSVHIFTELGIEPYGRIGLGIIELITAILILLSRTQIFGMIISLGIIIGAIGSHLLVLGINVSGDGGGLFGLAIVVFICSSIYLIRQKKQIISLMNKIFN